LEASENDWSGSSFDQLSIFGSFVGKLVSLFVALYVPGLNPCWDRNLELGQFVWII